LSGTIIRLERALLAASSDLPLDAQAETTVFWGNSQASFFSLASDRVCPATFVSKSAVGFYPAVSSVPWTYHGGLFSVTLSVGSPRPDVIRYRVSVKPGLSSNVKTLAIIRPPDRCHFTKIFLFCQGDFKLSKT